MDPQSLREIRLDQRFEVDHLRELHAEFGHLIEEAELELRKTEAQISELEPPQEVSEGLTSSAGSARDLSSRVRPIASMFSGMKRPSVTVLSPK